MATILDEELLSMLSNEMVEFYEKYGSFEINQDNANRYRVDLVDANVNQAGEKTLRIAVAYILDRKGNAQVFDRTGTGKPANWVTIRSASVTIDNLVKLATFSNADPDKAREALELYHQYWTENKDEMYASLASSRAWFGFDNPEAFMVFDFTIFDGSRVNPNGRVTVGITNIGINQVRLSNPRGFSLGLGGGIGLAKRERLIPATALF